MIENNPVIYLPEKDIIFCKNTAVPYKKVLEALYGAQQLTEFPDKNLTIRKDTSVVTLGCLTTTISNCNTIKRNVSKINKK